MFDRLFRPHEGADDEENVFLSCFKNSESFGTHIA